MDFPTKGVITLVRHTASPVWMLTPKCLAAASRRLSVPTDVFQPFTIPGNHAFMDVAAAWGKMSLRGRADRCLSRGSRGGLGVAGESDKRSCGHKKARHDCCCLCAESHLLE